MAALPASNWNHTPAGIRTAATQAILLSALMEPTLSPGPSIFSNAASFVGGAAPTTLGNGSANSYIIGGNSASNSTFSVKRHGRQADAANKLLRFTQVGRRHASLR